MIQDLVATYRVKSKTEREKGTYFEELIRTYFHHEPRFAGFYSDVWLYSDWAKEIGTPEFSLSAKDTGIDLVAKTQGTDEYHANLWGTETMGNAKYPLELFLRVITVNLETNRIVAGLPELGISVESPE